MSAALNDVSPVQMARSGRVNHPATNLSSAGLSGPWFHDGRPTSINVALDGRNLIITNEFGYRSSGYIADHRELVIPSLGIRGHVSHGERRIS